MSQAQDYPKVDLVFLVELLKTKAKCQGVINEGKTTSYIIRGTDPIAKRIVCIREIDGLVDFEFATGAAMRMKCMPELLKWLEENRKWKDGAYFK